MPQELRDVLKNWKSNLLAPLRSQAELQAQEDSEREGLALAMQHILNAQAHHLVELISGITPPAKNEEYNAGFSAAQGGAINIILNSLHAKPDENNQTSK